MLRTLTSSAVCKSIKPVVLSKPLMATRSMATTKNDDEVSEIYRLLKKSEMAKEMIEIYFMFCAMFNFYTFGKGIAIIHDDYN